MSTCYASATCGSILHGATECNYPAGAIKAAQNRYRWHKAERVHDGLLHLHLRHCSSAASAVRRLSPAVRTTTPAFDVRFVGNFLWPAGGLELATRLFTYNLHTSGSLNRVQASAGVRATPRRC